MDLHFSKPLGPLIASAKRHPSELPLLIHKYLSPRELIRRETSRRPGISASNSPYSIDASLNPKNRGKNRYRDIAAYDRTRVKVGGEEGERGYLNASVVTELDGNRSWVAAQAPLPKTIATFYAYLLTSPTTLVVQLTPLVERGMAKADPYLPPLANNQAPVLFDNGDWAVKVRSTRQETRRREGCVLTELEISGVGASENQKKTIRHLYFGGWPDKGVPTGKEGTAELLRFIALANELNKPAPKSTEKDDLYGPPILVHCSAGVGRTGSFISIASLLRLLPSSTPFPLEPTNNPSALGPLPDEVALEPVAVVIDHCREQRNMMVETREQVDLVWRAGEMIRRGEV